VLSGFRVPCIIASPFSRVGGKQAAVNHNFYDHTSVLKMIEWRWGLEPLTRRDASHLPTDPGNLATALNFSHAVSKVPKLPVLAAFTPVACAPSSTTTTEPPGIGPADSTGRTEINATAAATSAVTSTVTSTVTPTAAQHTTWTDLAQSSLMNGWA
jgi:phospholipase C